MNQVHIYLFGRFEVLRAEVSVRDAAWGRKKTKDLLKILVSERGRTFTQDQLIELLYPGAEPDKVVKNLRGRVSELRKALQPDLVQGAVSDYVLTLGQGYCFNPKAPCWVDAEAFEGHLHAARKLLETDRFAESLQEYEQAVALYRADYLVEDPYEDWALEQRAHHQKRLLAAFEEMAQCHAHLGQYAQALSRCQQLLQREPHRESAYQMKMRLHYYMGQTQSAVEAYHACQQALKDQWGTEPSAETKRLYLQITKNQLPMMDKPVPNNLPVALTPFVGRRAELQALQQYLADPACRLLTVTGPGGIGKSRLALQAACGELGRFSDGVYWVSLASLASAQLLPIAIAQALRFSLYGNETPALQLARYLREKRMLLVVDNVEHLVEGAPLLAEILATASQVKCIATSRVRLNVEGEWVYALDGLSCPSTEAGWEHASDFDAVELFSHVARKVDARWSLREHAREVVGICRRVEGAPLAIELAASWIEVLSCADILRAIESNLDVPLDQAKELPPRQRSLRAAFEYSWNLLSEDERQQVARLSVFRGGFTSEAADRVAGAQLAHLSHLVGKSFLRRTSANRYHMHELLREYAQEKLKQSPFHLPTQVACVRCYADHLKRWEGALKGVEQLQAMHAIGVEMDNVRLSWQWALEQAAWTFIAQGLESLYLFLEMKGWFAEGEALCAAAIERLSRETGRDCACLVTRLTTRRGRFLYHLSQLSAAEALFEQSCQRLPLFPDTLEEAFVMFNLGVIAENQGDYPLAQAHLDRSLCLYQAAEDAFGCALVLSMQGIVAFDEGRYEEAMARYEQSLAICRHSGNVFVMSKVLNNQGNVHQATDALRQAVPFYEESLQRFRQLEVRYGEQTVLSNLGGTYNALKEHEKAREYYRESLTLSRHIGYQSGAAMAMINLSDVEFHLGNVKDAGRYMLEGLQAAKETRLSWLILDGLALLSRQLRDQGKPLQALELMYFVAKNHPMEYMRDTAEKLIAETQIKVPQSERGKAQQRAEALQLEQALDQVETLLAQ